MEGTVAYNVFRRILRVRIFASTHCNLALNFFQLGIPEYCYHTTYDDRYNLIGSVGMVAKVTKSCSESQDLS